MSRAIAAVMVVLAAAAPLGAQSGFWGPPQNLGAPVNSPADELSGAVTDSGRTLVFARTEAGQNDLFVSHREGDVWGRPAWISELNTTAYNEVNPTFSYDGQRMFFASDRPGGAGGFDIWTTTWNGVTWSAPEPLGSEINSESDEWYAAPGPDGLYLAARIGPGADRGDILFAAGTHPSYAARVPVDVFATSAREMSVFPAPDGATLYVTSDRPGTTGLDDLWQSVREDDSWSAPDPLLCGINGPDQDEYPACVPGGLELLFASYRRPDGEGGADLYVSPWHALGDVTGDQRAATGDIIYLVNYLFTGGAPPLDPLVDDANCDASVGVLDVVVLVNYILRAGPAPCIDCAP